MPLKPAWESEPRILNVQHTAMERTRGANGRVKVQWYNELGVASGRHASKLVALVAQLVNAPGGKTPQTVRTRQDPQCAVGFVGIVQMQAHCEHLLEKFHGWLNMRNALL